MVKDFYTNYSKNGFFFKKDILTRYCLSLFTKPFVILSGISGTGKTKIAQLFKVPDAPQSQPAKATKTRRSTPKPYILLNLTKGIVSDDGRGNLQYNDETKNAIWSVDELKVIEKKIKALVNAGDDNIIDPIYITIKDSKQNVTIGAGVYLQRAKSPLVRLRFVSKRGETPAYDHRSYFQKYWKVNDVLRLEKIGEREFEIVRENDKEDVDEVREEIQFQSNIVNNMCFVSVKSNWTDSSEIFGYYNPIEEKFLVGKVLRFFLQANEFPNKPFFLILDEMNLSKVEYYFSDFLSCIESRYLENGVIKQEPITLLSGKELVNTNDEYFDLIKTDIAVPLNMYVTGTINVDETTYMFSPKVLDRANVIEFNDVSFEEYVKTTPDDNKGLELTKFPPFGKVELASKEHFVKLDKPLQDFFIELNKLLTPYNLHFGYRVMNEISLFLINLKEHCNADESTFKKGKDFQIVQKILPKFNGNLGKLEVPLKALLVKLNPKVEDAGISLTTLDELNPEDSDFPLSVRKLKSMLIQLYQTGYTNFIE